MNNSLVFSVILPTVKMDFARLSDFLALDVFYRFRYFSSLGNPVLFLVKNVEIETEKLVQHYRTVQQPVHRLQIYY